jgi:hypothetical protein
MWADQEPTEVAGMLHESGLQEWAGQVHQVPHLVSEIKVYVQNTQTWDDWLLSEAD